MINLVSIYLPVYDNGGYITDMVLVGKINTQKIDFINYAERKYFKDKVYFYVEQNRYYEAYIEKEEADKL